MSWELIPDPPQPRQSAGGPATRRSGPWWGLFAVGAVVALLGVALLIWPFFAASRILAFLVGAALLANGLAAIVGSRARGVGVPAGVLLLLLGALALIFPEFTVSVLVSFVAVIMLIVGVLWLLVALRFKAATGIGSLWIPGVLVALGLAALIWPAFALSIAAIATGVVMLLIGGSLIAAAFALRRATRATRAD